MFGGPSGRLPENINHKFSEAPQANIQRSVFDRSHGLKTTFDTSVIVPIFVDEVLPGDSFNLNMSVFARLSTPLVPIMDNLYIDFHFFFVPNRLVWDNWDRFMGEARPDPDSSIDYTVPQITALGWNEGEVGDYFGIPINLAGTGLINSLHFRCYNLIWNEWYRDENLQDGIVVDKDDGPDTKADYALLQRRGKRHDYFTSCLPLPQKGPAVSLPLGTTAPVIGLGSLVSDTYSVGPVTRRESDGGTASYAGYGNVDAAQGNSVVWTVEEDPSNADFPFVRTDLTNATAASVNAVREAFQIQRLLERDMRGGTRYIEIIKSHFGVTSPDARLQRPEYLGGGTKQINFTPIPNTSDTATADQGELAAFATAAGTGIGFTKSFVEHGCILGLASVRADLTYQQGINRMWDRQDRYDYYWPVLAHLGEQAVLQREIFADGVPANEALVFGYQERWAEYRYKPSYTTGLMRSDATGSLDFWHLAIDFSAAPLLDAAFIQESVAQARILADATANAIIMDAHFSLKCARPMPTYSVPGMIDHF